MWSGVDITAFEFFFLGEGLSWILATGCKTRLARTKYICVFAFSGLKHSSTIQGQALVT